MSPDKLDREPSQALSDAAATMFMHMCVLMGMSSMEVLVATHNVVMRMICTGQVGYPEIKEFWTTTAPAIIEQYRANMANRTPNKPK